jgi:putative glycosyltransferase (TIGR04372 family)
MERVLDYATLDWRDDVLDVFLMARPRFFLGTNSGPAWVAGSFGVPALLTNWTPIGVQSHYANSVTVPHLLWSNDMRRRLTFAEQLAEPFGFTESFRRLGQLGIAPIANSSDEIAEAVKEMMSRTGGTWPPDADDAKRQQRFRELQKRSNADGRSSIGRAFLRAHADLLDT